MSGFSEEEGVIRRDRVYEIGKLLFAGCTLYKVQIRLKGVYFSGDQALDDARVYELLLIFSQIDSGVLVNNFSKCLILCLRYLLS